MKTMSNCSTLQCDENHEQLNNITKKTMSNWTKLQGKPWATVQHYEENHKQLNKMTRKTMSNCST
jgi:hypothetical protein